MAAEEDQKKSTQVTDPLLLSEEKLEHGWRLHLQVPRDLYYFQGHFTGTPVVAGVCQLKWVVDFIARYWGRRVALSAMEAVKFHQLLLPEQKFHIEIKSRDERKWSYRITRDTDKIASGRIVDGAQA